MNLGTAIAGAVTPFVADAAARFAQTQFGGNRYDTTQADQAAARNTGNTQNKTREQLEYEAQLEAQRNRSNLGLQQQNDLFSAGLGNNISNANFARNSAGAAQDALNNVYMNAGNRLNQAIGNTQNAINQSAANVMGLFR